MCVLRCGAWQQSKGTFAYSGAASFRALIIHGSMTDSVYSNWLGVAFEDVRKETFDSDGCGLVSPGGFERERRREVSDLAIPSGSS